MGELEQLQVEAAKRFLQTALIVDDRASVTTPAVEEVEVPPEAMEPRGPVMGDDELMTDEEKSSGSDETQKSIEKRKEERASEVNVKDLADRFADLVGLTCGILKPTKEEENDQVTDRIVRAARGVDIVVIDWMLEDPGFTARDAIARIVEEERRDRRLLAIYTTQRDLDAILDELIDAIPKAKRGQDGLVLDVGGIRIVIYHKGGAKLEPAFEPYVCLERDLPDRLVAEFAAQTAGLVPAVALSALAATRESTHRLLGRLHQGLDLGYIGHLIRLPNFADGRQHLLDAINGEFRAAVEDDRGTATVAEKGFDAWMKDEEEQLRVSIPALKDLGPALAEGGSRKEKWKADHVSIKVPKITTLLVAEGSDSKALDSDAGFAQLMAMRRPYSGQDPPLHLGTIVREEEVPDNFWLCIQPVCDSVRLEGPTSFLMLPLDPVKSNSRVSFVVTLPDDSEKFVYLRLWEGSSDLELVRVVPNQSGGVTFSSEENGVKKVVTDEGVALTWVAQLKPAHASRVGHLFGTRLSRIGLDESEWIRTLERFGQKSTRRERVPFVERARNSGNGK